MTPANAAKSSSVTPGTEIEAEDYKFTALCDMTTIETFLAGATALIENAVEMLSGMNGRQPDSDLMILQGLHLISEAAKQVDKTRSLLDEGSAKDSIAQKQFLGPVPADNRQGGAA